jgi:hypothetical protein
MSPISKSKPLIYLAVPYSHKDPKVKEQRFQMANRASAILMGRGDYVFSPISHTHPIALAGNLPGGFEFWEGYDRTMLKCCDVLYVLKIDGWETSVGVTAERRIARELGIPAIHVTIEELEEHEL